MPSVYGAACCENTHMEFYLQVDYECFMPWHSRFVSSTLHPDVDSKSHFYTVQLSMTSMLRTGVAGPVGKTLATQAWGVECESPEPM